MNERLGLFMREQNMTAAKLAEILQIQPSSISHLLSGRNKPNFDFIARILRMFSELNPDWLINGYGEMYRDQISSITVNNVDNSKFKNEVTSSNKTNLIADKEEVTQNTIVTQNDLFTVHKNDTVNDFQPHIPLDDLDEKPDVISINNSKDSQSVIDKIIVFYSDQTFSIYSQR